MREEGVALRRQEGWGSRSPAVLLQGVSVGGYVVYAKPDLLSDVPVLAAVADGGGQWEAISALSALSVLPLPLTNMSASRGFRMVAKDTKTTLLRAIYVS